MESILPAVAIGLLVLACPLMMVGMGVGAWVIARARGQKKDLSMGCMPMAGHGEQQQAAQPAEASGLKEEVARLQREVEGLRAQLSANGTAPNGGVQAIARDEPTPESIQAHD